MSFKQNYQLWKDHYSLLPSELQLMFDQLTGHELEESFNTDLEFGTAGLRGILGAGTGRMNIFTVRRATLAFIKFLKTKFTTEELKTKGIVIGCDNRQWSQEFKVDIANLFSNHEILAKVFPLDEYTPTPIVSFAVQAADCIGGIVITASHNPREYNGYKIYDQFGCQYLPDATDQIGQYYQAITNQVFKENKPAKQAYFQILDDHIKTAYLQMIYQMQFYPNQPRKIKIVFSNFHGTAKTWTPVILADLGYEVIVVQEQYEYDPNFTNCPNPNPEILSNYDLAIKYAKTHDADLIIVNDPDADRIGIGVKVKVGEYQLLTGNETAPVLLEYWLGQHKKFNQLPTNGVMYNTFVTSDLSDQVAKKWGMQVIKTLTGFKWIGAQIPLEASRNLKFMFGFEEAYGYVLNPKTRDKDGIQSSIVLAEACDYYAKQNKTLVDILDELYQEFGYYHCYTVNEVYEGLAGQETITKILHKLRNEDIVELNGIKCIKKEDYINGLYNMPGQNLLKFYFADNSWFAVRASGTEPKIKFYYVCVSRISLNDAKNKQTVMHNDLKRIYLK